MNQTQRNLSVDIFRGLTIFLMVFVNDIAGISHIPNWLKHAEDVGLENTMTIVDLVFPAFLFIMGMSIPLAIESRLSKGTSQLKLFGHIMLRVLGLLLIGVYMVNMEHYQEALTGVSRTLWIFLLFFSVLIIWNQYPKTPKWMNYLGWFFRFIGGLILVYLGSIYLGKANEQIVWMKTYWWGILGLIGWAYLVGCLSYLVFRKNILAQCGVLALLVLLNIGDRAGAHLYLGKITDYIWLAGVIGGHGSLALAGIVLSLYMSDKQENSIFKNIRGWWLGYAVVLLFSGYLLQPLYGISKNNATPTWCLYSAGICVLVYYFLYWLVDVKKIQSWAGFLKPAGSNPLLAYILPNLVYSSLGLLGITFLHTHFKSGFPGFLRSLGIALFILGLTALLSKLKFKLKL